MTRFMRDIADFQEKFGLKYVGPPRELDLNTFLFRYNFMSEELEEYNDARDEHNKVKQLDALVDLVYVALGTAALHGFDFNEAWRRVHAANMTKIRGESNRCKNDIVKPSTFIAPYLEDLV